jgi:hypothetical protein
LPKLFYYSWHDFLELHNARSSNGYSANPIGFLEIESWSRLKNISLSSNEIDIIRQLDNLYLNHSIKQQKAKHNGN